MNGQGKLLTHYLKNADKLIIPVYQRNYDWREEHCKKLYQDLVRTIQNKKRWHFFGGIVSVSDPMGSSSDYLVIDGQQHYDRFPAPFGYGQPDQRWKGCS